MSTDAQINANRENAQKSTGPVTAEGQAVVAQNALKHGLFAVQDVITTENQQEFDLLREQMLVQLAPAGAVESMLAHRAISLAWRLKRAETMQSQAIEEMIESHISNKQWHLGRRTVKDPRDAPEYLALGRIANKDWCGSRLIERLFEYERRIENSLYKAIAQLRAMQLVRQMAESNAAEAQHPAQVDKSAEGCPPGDGMRRHAPETNSEKQSQSVKTESSSERLPDRFQQWPDTYGIDPKELSAFVKKTYGHRYPEMVEALLKHWNTSPARSTASAEKPVLALSPQTHTSGGKTGGPLSILKL